MFSRGKAGYYNTWFHGDRDKIEFYRCHDCGVPFGYVCKLPRYCPNCGKQLYYMGDFGVNKCKPITKKLVEGSEKWTER